MTNGFLNMMAQISIKNVNEFIGDLAYQPLISIILPTFNSNLNFLTQAIESVEGQSYPNWQLCIADDASTDKDLLDYLKELENNEKISIIYRIPMVISQLQLTRP